MAQRPACCDRVRPSVFRARSFGELDAARSHTRSTTAGSTPTTATSTSTGTAAGSRGVLHGDRIVVDTLTDRPTRWRRYHVSGWW